LGGAASATPRPRESGYPSSREVEAGSDILPPARQKFKETLLRLRNPMHDVAKRSWSEGEPLRLAKIYVSLGTVVVAAILQWKLRAPFGHYSSKRSRRFLAYAALVAGEFVY
jgi:hypothetical protein